MYQENILQQEIIVLKLILINIFFDWRKNKKLKYFILYNNGNIIFDENVELLFDLNMDTEEDFKYYIIYNSIFRHSFSCVFLKFFGKEFYIKNISLIQETGVYICKTYSKYNEIKTLFEKA